GGPGFPSRTTSGVSLEAALLSFPAQRVDRGLEVFHRRERLVDAREAQIGDLVEFAQRAQNRQAHLVGVHFGHPGGAHGFFYLLGQECQIVLGDRTALARLPNTGDDLVPAERLNRAGAFHHVQTGSLHGGEPATALRTLPATANGSAVLGRSGIDDPRIAVTAERAVHEAAGSLRSADHP